MEQSNGIDFKGNEQKFRSDSESSIDDDICIEPLDLDDILKHVNNISLSVSDVIEEIGESKVSLFSIAMSLKRKEKSGKPMPLALRKQSRATRNWLKAMRKTSDVVDPWDKFHLDELPVEKAVRHLFDALNQTWTTEEVLVKMEKESFAAGAMREAFRMKKLSNFSQNQDWSRDSNNYVAKSYMDSSVAREIYFEDVKLQMDAKLWGQEFNRHNPPKKVDIFMMAVLEMVERPGAPLFHIEHYIDGEYIKYNSNSGYVDNQHCRNTPHAFSHFTFERSGHELIVVDVQGVGDLYTDPQIHTAKGTEYGDGNLGVKGMALFFHSHSCNPICKSLGLTQFDLAPKELEEIKSGSSSENHTLLRGNEVICEAPSGSERANNLEKLLRHVSVDSGISLSRSVSNNSESEGSSATKEKDSRPRLNTQISQFIFDEGAMKSFQEKLEEKAKPSNLTLDNVHDDSILGQVHLALANYHEVSRFSSDGTFDKEAAIFHLKSAADCGIISAIVSMAKMYLGLPHDILSEVTLEAEDLKQGLHYMEKAANAKDRQSMTFMARSYDSGINGTNKDLDMALYWYESIAALDEEKEGVDTDDMSLDDPPYIILAKLAELWLSGLLKQGRDANKAGEFYNQAAESAMAAMKGKLSNKYYMLAEEAWAQLDE